MKINTIFFIFGNINNLELIDPLKKKEYSEFSKEKNFNFFEIDLQKTNNIDIQLQLIIKEIVKKKESETKSLKKIVENSNKSGNFSSDNFYSLKQQKELKLKIDEKKKTVEEIEKEKKFIKNVDDFFLKYELVILKEDSLNILLNITNLFKHDEKKLKNFFNYLFEK
jgi:hypothetical protein